MGLGTTQVGEIVQNIVPKIEGRKNIFAYFHFEPYSLNSLIQGILKLLERKEKLPLYQPGRMPQMLFYSVFFKSLP